MLKTNNLPNKIVSIVLTLAMIISMFSLCVSANASVIISTESVEIDGVTYTGIVEQIKNGTLKVTVTNNKNDEMVEMVRNGDILQITESGYDVQNSTLTIPSIEHSDIMISPMASSHSQDFWWGFYSYYDTNPLGSGDIYWSIRKSDRYPYNMTYYANHGTPLMNYSDKFDYEVNQLIGWEYATIAITGAEVALTIAGLLTAGMIAAPALLVAALLTLGTLATASIPLINAWSAAKEAEKNFDYIGNVLGY